MKYLMSLMIKTKTRPSIKNKNKEYVSKWLRSISLNGGHRPLYPFFLRCQAWMKLFLLQPSIDKNKRIVYYGKYE